MPSMRRLFACIEFQWPKTTKTRKEEFNDLKPLYGNVTGIIKKIELSCKSLISFSVSFRKSFCKLHLKSFHQSPKSIKHEWNPKVWYNRQLFQGQYIFWKSLFRPFFHFFWTVYFESQKQFIKFSWNFPWLFPFMAQPSLYLPKGWGNVFWCPI